MTVSWVFFLLRVFLPSPLLCSVFSFFSPPHLQLFFLVLSSFRMPCGPLLSVVNARVKAAVFFFFSGEEDEQCLGYFAFWSLMF